MFSSRLSRARIAGLRLVLTGGITFLLVFFYTYSVTASAERRVYEGKRWVSLPVANSRLTKSTRISRPMLRMRRFLRADANPVALERVDQIVGKVVQETIYPGEQITSNRLGTSTVRRASTFVTPGKVAVSIGEDTDWGLAQAVQAGDRIDIVLPADGRLGANILENIEVLGRVGRGAFKGLAPTASTNTEGAALVLEVSRQQAVALANAQESGKLRILLRSSWAGANRE